MTKLCIFVGTTIGSYGGWYLADAAGCSFMVCFLVSGVASVAGVWLGWKFARRFE